MAGIQVSKGSVKGMSPLTLPLCLWSPPSPLAFGPSGPLRMLTRLLYSKSGGGSSQGPFFPAVQNPAQLPPLPPSLSDHLVYLSVSSLWLSNPQLLPTYFLKLLVLLLSVTLSL